MWKCGKHVLSLCTNGNSGFDLPRFPRFPHLKCVLCGFLTPSSTLSRRNQLNGQIVAPVLLCFWKIFHIFKAKRGVHFRHTVRFRHTLALNLVLSNVVSQYICIKLYGNFVAIATFRTQQCPLCHTMVFIPHSLIRNNLKFFVATSTSTLETRCHSLETSEKNYQAYTLR